MQKPKKKVIVVGGGLAGLAATMKLAENGIHVQLVSLTQVRRSHSVCAQGGINAAMNLRGEEDSPYIHAYDTIKGGDFLGDQPPILEMCLAAPGIIRLMDRIGCPFNRTVEGNLDFRRFGGTLYHRTAFCGASTGQQLLYSLDEQVRRYEANGMVEKFEHHEFIRLILDDSGIARGIVYIDLVNLKIDVLKGDAVLFGTGGLGVIFKKSTNSTLCTGAANGRLFMQGMDYANGEFVQIHPTAIPGLDKLRLISESTRGEGGRIWTFGDSSKTISYPDGSIQKCGETGKPWYFLEEMYPGYGNLVARDVASREILRVCKLGLGVEGRMQVYLDMTHLPKTTLSKVESVLEIYRKFTGEDPHKTAMKIFPAVHYSMGGAWVDWPSANAPDRETRFRQMTNIRGCFNVGESEFLYHGANRLGANSMLSCIFAGFVAGKEIPRYLDSLTQNEISSTIYSTALTEEEKRKKELLSRDGKENIHQLHEEMADLLVRHVTVERNNKDLEETVGKLKEIRRRYEAISLDDKGSRLNQTYLFAHQFRGIIEIALLITKGALLRNESRGAHFKPQYPDRDDKDWLKTSIASYHPDEPNLSYVPVALDHLKPFKRDYTKASKSKPKLENIPTHIELPI